MKERMSKYWICELCAEKLGWKCIDYAITITSGLCGHCEREDECMLIPTSDFIKDGKKPVWD